MEDSKKNLDDDNKDALYINNSGKKIPATISVVTVCKNAQKDVKKTMLSVIKQSKKPFEYIIVDGNSVDDTLNVVKYLKKKYDAYYLKCISEEDKGIYDAMNKAIKMANGEWLIFMNAGDTFYNVDVLKNIVNLLDESYDFVYGDACYLDDGYKYIVKGKEAAFFRMGMPFCHQSIFNKTKSIKEYMFSNKYLICADYDLYNRAYNDGKKFIHYDVTICNYLMGGESSKRSYRRIKEIAEIRKNSGYILFSQLFFLVMSLRVLIGKVTRHIVPARILTIIRRKKQKL